MQETPSARVIGVPPLRMGQISEQVRLRPLVMAAGAALLVALTLRLWGLGAKGLWFDETYSLFLAKQPVWDIPRLTALYDTHPPLYYVLLHLWTVLVGRSEAAVRLLSVIFSLGTIVVTFLLARRIAGQRAAVLATGLLSIAPFQVMASQEARMYPLLALLVAGASYMLWLAMEEGGTRRWVAYAVLMVLALYTHHFAFLVIAAHGVAVLGAPNRRDHLPAWSRSLVLIALGYAPLIPNLLTQFATAQDWPNIRPPFGLRALTDLMGLFAFGGGLFDMGTYHRRGVLPLLQRLPLLLPFLFLVAAGVAGIGAHRRRVFVLAYWLVPIVILALISVQWNLFYDRYFSFVLPPFCILMASGIIFLADQVGERMRRTVFVALVGLVAAFNIPGLIEYYRAAPQYDWRGAARHLSTQARPDDFLLFVPGFARIPFEYYFTGSQARMSLNPTEVVVAPRQVEVRPSIAPERIEALAKQYPRLWIVATIPLGYQARDRLGRLLQPYFKEVEGKEFGLVWTFLWESRRK